MKKTFIAIAITLMPFKLVSDDIWVGLFAKKVPYTAETFVYGEDLSEFNNAIDREWNNGLILWILSMGMAHGVQLWKREQVINRQVYLHKEDILNLRIGA